MSKDLGLSGGDYISRPAWEHLRVPQEELESGLEHPAKPAATITQLWGEKKEEWLMKL